MNNAHSLAEQVVNDLPAFQCGALAVSSRRFGPTGALHGYGIALLELRLAAPRATARLPEILAAVST
ncbi:hypothetical protein [Streptomyces sp. NPDC055681]